MLTAQPTVRSIPIIDLINVYNKLKPEIDSAISKVLNKSNFIGGEEVKLFSNELSSYLDGCQVVTCANGTDAIQIAYMALGLNPGDKVIIPAFNYVAAAEAAALLSLIPVFVDADPHTFNLDVNKLEAAIDPETKAIVVVHLFGQSPDMEAIMAISEKYNLKVIEDNAQAIGSEITTGKFAGKKLGTIGHIGTTSFFPSKNLGCMGDGGAVLTTNPTLADRVRMIANHGQKSKYNYELIGMNSRLDTIQAAILRIKLLHLEAFTKSRQSIAARYDEAFSGRDDISIPARSPFSNHVFHQYTIKLKDRKTRDELQKWLGDIGIQSMIYYPQSLHLQLAYQNLGYKISDFPVAEELSEIVLSLPMHSELGIDDQNLVCNSVIEFLDSQN